ncbi:MAG TPA: NAD(P)H-binding protein, partial [Terriglobales bacterium]|nr:NAD(P)H-binding protein [Terriglobales bacterium]
MKILISGATGYIGSKLVCRLVALGHEVTCMVRDLHRVTSAHQGTRIVVADCLQPQSLACAMEGIDVAYYLVHSMSAGSSDFQERDVQAARNFAVA